MYLELHTASAFSFLDGASTPEALVERAAALGYSALALLDRDGVYGVPRFHKAAMTAGIRPIIGCELTIRTDRVNGSQSNKKRLTPLLRRLPVLVESKKGYRHLCQLVTRMKLRSPKGKGSLTLDDFEGSTEGLVALAGQSIFTSYQTDVDEIFNRLRGLFGRSNVYVEVQRHLLRDEESQNRLLIDLASAYRAPVIATNGVRFATVGDRLLHDVLTCVRYKTTLDRVGRRLTRNSERYLKSPDAMERLFRDLPGALRSTEELASRLQYSMNDLEYRFPVYPVPDGDCMGSFLRKVTEIGARERYRPYHERARQQIARELALIEKLDLAGYFLIVWDLVNFCRRHDILVQGRGSAANSAVCYSLGITAVDPVGMDLLFERFLSEEREEWPDIDLDLPSGDRREQVIQYVYERYGQVGAAMTANVITYRGRSAMREVGKVLGINADRINRLAKTMGKFEWTDSPGALTSYLNDAKSVNRDLRVRKCVELWQQIQHLPRHLGQHSGGMVLCRGRLDEVVPLEPASMPGRVVIQWDKDDCADMGIIKVDLLGLGMMAVLQDAIGMVNKSTLKDEGQEVIPRKRPVLDLGHLPQDDPDVYQMLQKADTIGVFQVESRAQMATLPRLRPACFYDLVVEVALIRPGPIVGKMVHPYLKRRSGQAPVVYAHPSLEPILRRTLGVPLFQEQLLRIAMVAAGFSGGEAEELRRAFGFKRSNQKMEQIENRLRVGMARQGITDKAADEIVRSITSFAMYGFPESHAASFALLVYASAYLKVHFPTVFYVALLNNQPMGFYHPSTLIRDAQRRGIKFQEINVQRSDWLCTVEDEGVIRLGLRYVLGLRESVGQLIQSARTSQKRLPVCNARFNSIDDLVTRTKIWRNELVALAQIGALSEFGHDRRAALWQVEHAIRPAGELFQKSESANQEIDNISPLSSMTPMECVVADYVGTGLTLGPHPMAFRRDELVRRGVTFVRDLPKAGHGCSVRVAGAVVTRQRPSTAKGFVFLTLEDETGLANIIIRPDLFSSERVVITKESFLMVEGTLQIQERVVSIKAERIQRLAGDWPEIASHDFH